MFVIKRTVRNTLDRSGLVLHDASGTDGTVSVCGQVTGGHPVDDPDEVALARFIPCAECVEMRTGS